MTLEQLLLQLALNISSTFIYDVVKGYFAKEKNPTIEGLKAELSLRLNIEGADIKSNNIIQFLAQNGDINVSGTQIYASKSVTMASSQGTQFTFGNNSKSSTGKSSIQARHGAQIHGQGDARMEQDEEGNIKFYT
ncbi:hypothetical protein A2982_01990 [candidate division WWE3 bacterium RIFCSPLOWO2_01_FULL_39_13]|uniref:Uncharacterized protein n=1 Tax=candidate division WWE3 bacterium RIFCSPLOWO2_01_FULL_39_13 TaxID=1802624 RepID=A0A1F4V3K2_UNCKA|nr:MAG: hypothetical protein A2982_01990 [candidate division WWE3 bacterium RIFCSPLOWO2_01_FULL_39_13]